MVLNFNRKSYHKFRFIYRIYGTTAMNLNELHQNSNVERAQRALKNFEFFSVNPCTKIQRQNSFEERD